MPPPTKAPDSKERPAGVEIRCPKANFWRGFLHASNLAGPAGDSRNLDAPGPAALSGGPSGGSVAGRLSDLQVAGGGVQGYL